MTIADIAARCSKFSGWNLEVKVEAATSGPTIRFADPSDQTSQSVLSLYLDQFGLLKEAYGRMAHWGITNEERRVLRNTLVNAVS